MHQDGILMHLLPGILCNDGSILTEEVLSRLNSPEKPHSSQPSSNIDYQPVKADVEVDLEMISEGGQRASSPSAGDFIIQGDPTETCILTLAVSLSASAEKVKMLRKNLARVGEIPFDSATKYMATMHLIDKDVCVKMQAACNGIAPHSPSESELEVDAGIYCCI
jgi:magnesium-transporting ATPase (P-type)